MPRNEIATIIGLIVTAWYMFMGPGRSQGLPRTPRAIVTVLIVFVIAFLVTWIVLRLFGY
jgi:hypothetical protein